MHVPQKSLGMRAAYCVIQLIDTSAHTVSGNVELGQFTAHCRAVTYGCEFLPFPEKVDDMPHCTACVKEYCRAIRNHDCGFLRNQAFFFGIDFTAQRKRYMHAALEQRCAAVCPADTSACLHIPEIPAHGRFAYMKCLCQLVHGSIPALREQLQDLRLPII